LALLNKRRIAVRSTYSLLSVATRDTQFCAAIICTKTILRFNIEEHVPYSIVLQIDAHTAIAIDPVSNWISCSFFPRQPNLSQVPIPALRHGSPRRHDRLVKQLSSRINLTLLDFSLVVIPLSRPHDENEAVDTARSKRSTNFRNSRIIGHISFPDWNSILAGGAAISFGVFPAIFCAMDQAFVS
jgi:hypothetical protein